MGLSYSRLPVAQSCTLLPKLGRKANGDALLSDDDRTLDHTAVGEHQRDRAGGIDHSQLLGWIELSPSRALFVHQSLPAQCFDPLP